MSAVSPLEAFVRDYVSELGGVWDEVEPQVYDLLLPTAEAEGVVRVAFDPEALPEHPGSQLASFGTPLIERILDEAQRRGRFAELYVVGLNLSPHDLPQRLRRALTLGDELTLRLDRLRALFFVQAVFWFQAAFVSDQKEQEILPVAMDLHYGRQVRHLDQLVDHSRLAAEPAEYLPEAPRLSVAAAYPRARDEVLRTLAAMANTRNRELNEHMTKQIARMTAYYADLRAEIDELGQRADADAEKLATRRRGLDNEERLRVAELRQKGALRVQLRLLNLLLVQQPKLLLKTTALAANKEAGALELVWDPLTEAIEALPCPLCGRPTFTLGLSRMRQVCCPECAKTVPVRPRPAK